MFHSFNIIMHRALKRFNAALLQCNAFLWVFEIKPVDMSVTDLWCSFVTNLPSTLLMATQWETGGTALPIFLIQDVHRTPTSLQLYLLFIEHSLVQEPRWKNPILWSYTIVTRSYKIRRKFLYDHIRSYESHIWFCTIQYD